ncbi:MAG: hypothetical protein CMO29_05455 [Tistrella sp.]|nr:hemerythrin domain-containing protein [uncultured Tistrella sp.]MAM73242.1 hypothetical protein [Tistrella sp.]
MTMIHGSRSDAAITPILPLDGRYDLYGPVHKGLRRAGMALLDRLGRADFASPAATTGLLTELRDYLRLATAHIAHESDTIHRALEARTGPATEELDRQHADHHRSIAGLIARITALTDDFSGTREEAGRALYLAFAAHLARDFAHMHEEETVTTPLLQAVFSDAELAAIEMEIVSTLSPEMNLAFMRLIIPALSPAERVRLLGSVRATAPAEVFRLLMDEVARPLLPPADFADLALRLQIAA